MPFFKNFEINIDPTDQIEILENTDKVNFWVLPPLQEIPDELLAKISGGGNLISADTFDWYGQMLADRDALRMSKWKPYDPKTDGWDPRHGPNGPNYD